YDQRFRPVVQQVGDIQRGAGEDEGDDQKDPGVAGDADGDHLLFAVDGADHDAENQHRQENRDVEEESRADAEDDAAKDQQVLVLGLALQFPDAEQDHGGAQGTEQQGGQ